MDIDCRMTTQRQGRFLESSRLEPTTKAIIPYTSSEEFPKGARNLWKPTGKPLILSEKLSFTDYKGSSQEFNLTENTIITSAERILIDNIFIAHKKGDIKHQIACLNGLSLYFHNIHNNEICYILFTGDNKGIYKEWTEIIHYTKSQKNPKYKKYNSLSAAYKDAQIYLGHKYNVSEKLKTKWVEIYENPQLEMETSAEKATLQDQIIKHKEQQLLLEKQLQTERARNIELIKRMEDLQKEAKHKEEMISYAGATAGQPITKEDKIIERLSEIQQDLSTVISGLNQFDERPSEGWDEWWLEMACRANKIEKIPESTKTSEAQDEEYRDGALEQYVASIKM
ncbi:hypothetical protein Godav_003164 [Gossypium davidsonii]|uniref:Ribonuclease H1 N-terminal domain-containing protein n=1 Tax=Gossypium davidsonii TaxID=34287 RepID=A0A7J8SZB2_GOSDV|nr:hypothetical protein [Gossypium davidsonii]